jgi:hypothetical protein
MTKEQEKKVKEMCKNFFTDTVRVWCENEFVELQTHLDVIRMHYFEFCFRHLATPIANEYAKSHAYTTPSFAKYMILQKIAHEFEKHHPVDLLYDIWKNPTKYQQDL